MNDSDALKRQFGETTFAVPRPSATVLVLDQVRAAEASTLRVLCIRRSAQSGFFGGAVAFPGGKVDEADHAVRVDHAGLLAFPEAATAAPASISGSSQGGPPDGVVAANVDSGALLVCACRELLEEAGILPAAIGNDDVEALRVALKNGALFGEAIARAGITLDWTALVPFARWVTPTREPKRYDARFYLCRRPANQVGSSDLHETTEVFWETPHRLIERFCASEFQLPPPTLRCLELLAQVSTFEAARELAAQQTLLPICPEFVAADPPFLALPGDPTHSIATCRVGGGTRFVFRDGRFESAFA